MNTGRKKSQRREKNENKEHLTYKETKPQEPPRSLWAVTPKH